MLVRMKEKGFQSDRLKAVVQEACLADLSSVFRLAYVSRASSLFGPGDLEKIGRLSALRNSKADITGILVMNEGDILQILEGEKHSVVELFKKISRDPRHENVRQVYGGQRASRLLSSWSLVGGQGASAPESLMSDFHLLHAHLYQRREMDDITAGQVELLKVIALFRTVPL